MVYNFIRKTVADVLLISKSATLSINIERFRTYKRLLIIALILFFKHEGRAFQGRGTGTDTDRFSKVMLK